MVRTMTREPENGNGSDLGAKVRARRLALGLSVKALAERAGVDRSRVAVLEDGGTLRPATLGAILTALEAAEREAGLGPEGPAERPSEAPSGPRTAITFEVEGIKVTVEGSEEDREAVEASAVRAAYGLLTALDRHRRGEGPASGGS